MLQNGVIEESSSPYAFNVIVVGKKDDAGEEMDRLCINYAPFNKLTIPDRYPLPNIKKFLGVEIIYSDRSCLSILADPA